MSEIQKNLSMLLENAINEAVKKYLKEKEKSQPRYKKICETKNILENYRSLKAYTKAAVYTKNCEGLDLAANDSNVYAISIAESLENTRFILMYIDHILSFYKELCSLSENEEKIFYYLIYDMHINSKIQNCDLIANKYNISRATLFRYLNRAYIRLSYLIFGLYDMKNIFINHQYFFNPRFQLDNKN